MFANKVAVVTGGARGIGRVICEEFRKAGAHVCTIDKLPNDYFVGDLAEEKTLQAFAEQVIRDYGKIDFLVNNACLSRGVLKLAPTMTLIMCCGWVLLHRSCWQSCSRIILTREQ